MNVYTTNTICRGGILLSKHEIIVLFPEGIKAETCSRSISFFLVRILIKIITTIQPPHTYLRAPKFKKKNYVPLRPDVRERDLNITTLYSEEY